MASFVEQATLLVEDGASKKLNTINNAIKRMEKSAKSLQSVLKGFDIKVGNVDKAISSVRNLNKEIQRLRSPKGLSVKLGNVDKSLKQVRDVAQLLRSIKGPGALKLRVDSSQVTTAINRMNKLHSLMAKPVKPINLNVNQNQNQNPVHNPNLNPNRTRNPNNIPGNQNRAVNVNVGPLNAMLNGFLDRLGNTIENAIVSGFQKGFRTQDIADTRLGLQGLNEGDLAGARAAANRVSKEFPVLSRAQALDILGEALPVAKNDLQAAEVLTRATAAFVKLRVAMGDTTDAAIENAIQLSKAGEQSGQIIGPDGQIDAKKTEHFFELLTKAAIQGGKEVDPNLIRYLFKSLRTSKFTLDDKGILMAIALAEEQGSTAGVGLNQAIKQLAGYGVKKSALENQAAYGLRESETVTTTNKKGVTKTSTVAGDTKDEELLRENPLEWTQKYLIPAMQKLGLDPNNATQVSKFASDIASDRTAVEQIVTMIKRYQDLKLSVDSALARDVSPERLQQVTEASGLVAFQESRSQLQGLAGDIATSFEGILIPALKGVANAARGFSEFLTNPDGTPDPTKSALVGGGLAVAGVGAVKGGSMLFNMLNPFARFGGSVNQFSASVNQFSGAVANSGWQNQVGGGGGPPNRGRSLFVNAIQVAGAITTTTLIASTLDQMLTGGKGAETMQQNLGYFEKLTEMGNILLRIAQGLPTALDKPNATVDVAAEREKARAQVASLGQQIESLNQALVNNKDLAMPPAANQLVNQQIQQLTEQIKTIDPTGEIVNSLTTANTSFAATFETGASQLTQSGAAISTAATEAGPIMGQGILGVAAQFGASAGAAIAAAIQSSVANIKVNATTTTVPLAKPADTGSVGQPQ